MGNNSANDEINNIQIQAESSINEGASELHKTFKTSQKGKLGCVEERIST